MAAYQISQHRLTDNYSYGFRLLCSIQLLWLVYIIIPGLGPSLDSRGCALCIFSVFTIQAAKKHKETHEWMILSKEKMTKFYFVCLKPYYGCLFCSNFTYHSFFSYKKNLPWIQQKIIMTYQPCVFLVENPTYILISCQIQFRP